ncbi:MAG: tetratricopeptide repeat protein [Gemmatimonadota bacterium]|nr:MAG: tetratricopeptide repeat protein [Gemmatimonadota bacterium]
MRVKGFLAELKRRRVTRVAVVYAVVTFAVLQAADIIIPALQLPEWTLTLLVVVTLLGFPISLVLAWAYDLTPEGVKRAAVQPEDVPEHRVRPPRRAAPATTAVLLAAVLVVAASVWWVTRPAPSEIRALAVLPLTNLMGDPEQAYFADGLHDVLIGELAGISELTVISRTSVMRYRDTDRSMGEIAAELDVDALIEGSVFRAGDTVRITVQLIRGSPEDHLWQDRYEGRLSEALGLQTRVAEAIAGEIRLVLSPRETDRLARRTEVDPAAQEAYLRGRALWRTRSHAAMRRAVPYLEEAVALDSTFALAWSALADAYTMGTNYRALDLAPDEAYRRGEASAVRAVELDPDLAEAHAALGAARLWGAWDVDAAERSLRRALALNPNLAQAHNWLGDALVVRERPEEALESFRQARDLDPFSPLMHRDVARVLMYLGRCGEAISAARTAVELDPSHAMAHSVLQQCYRAAGRLEEAVEASVRFTEGFSRLGAGSAEGLRAAYDSAGWEGLLEAQIPLFLSLPNHYFAARAYVQLGRLDESFDALYAGIDAREAFTWESRVDPSFAPLHSDPRWDELLRRLGF